MKFLCAGYKTKTEIISVEDKNQRTVNDVTKTLIGY